MWVSITEDDEYIVTLKLGPVISQHWYDLDFDDFDISPETETQILFAARLDGRYRIDEDDFSGVNTFG